MNQLQYEIIRKIINTGAPVLAQELCGALENLVVAHNRMIDELKALKATESENQEA